MKKKYLLLFLIPILIILLGFRSPNIKAQNNFVPKNIDWLSEIDILYKDNDIYLINPLNKNFTFVWGSGGFFEYTSILMSEYTLNNALSYGELILTTFDTGDSLTNALFLNHDIYKVNGLGAALPPEIQVIKNNKTIDYYLLLQWELLSFSYQGMQYESGYNNGYNIGYQKALEGLDNENLYIEAYIEGAKEGRLKGIAEENKRMLPLLEEKEQEGFKKGYQEGYAKGANDILQEGGQFGFLGVLTAIFSGIGVFLGIELLPNITLGAIIAVPIVFGIIAFILGRRKD